MNEKSIATLRGELDAAVKTGLNPTPYIEAISLRYILEEHGYRYNKNNLDDYLQDYLDRNISSAEEYCIQGLVDKQLIDFPEKHFNFNRLSSDNQAKLKALFLVAKNRSQPPENLDELSFHYLEMDDDPKKIVYHQEDLFKYLQDWLRGVHFAEKHIKRASRENLDFFMDVVENGSKKLLGFRGKEFSDQDKKRIYQLVMEFLPAEDVMVKKFEILGLKQAILQAKNPEEGASILLIILTKNYATEILGDGITHNEFSSKLIETSAFCYLEDKVLLANFCNHFNFENKKSIAAKIYSFTLVTKCGDFPNGLDRLKDFEEKRKSRLGQTLSVKPRAVLDTNAPPLIAVKCANQEEISTQFYIASLTQDVQVLVDVGYKNGKDFHELLMTEFQQLSHPSTNKKALEIRTKFYQRLMAESDMRSLRTFGTLKETLIKAYQAKNLTVPEFPVITQVKIEPKKDAQTSANIRYEKTTEATGLASSLLTWIGSSKPSDDDLESGSNLKPDL